MSLQHKTNRLIHEKSPYLLQHAYNPVDWYPWGDDAFNKAKAEDKPVFLSIGYSACHWCHVMEKESFEDHDVARILNERFVSVKVDREQMPDVDHIYMEICMGLTGSGGWPLSCFLTGEGKPFYAGTYFPKAQFIKLLERIDDNWKNNKDNLLNVSDQITMSLQEGPPQEGELPEDIFGRAFIGLKRSYDAEYGGFSQAPKFPSVQNLLFLIRHYYTTGDEEAGQMVKHTLDCMYRGGIFDHIGGGFSRYSTDRFWLVPHFEKMMVDNAMLAMAYMQAGQLFDEEYLAVAKRILSYCINEMYDEGLGFFTSQDADSEGVEGKYYLFTPREAEEILGKEKGRRFCEMYDITERGNFEGKSIPNLIKTREYDRAFAAECRNKLYEARSKRTPPFKDDKCLSGVNGLMLAALSMASRYIGREYADIVNRLCDFIENRLFSGSRLYMGYRKGLMDTKATLDDYAYVLWGFLEACQAVPERIGVTRIQELCDQIIDLFFMENQFFMTGKDSQGLIVNPKNVYDGALPSGNSIVIECFLKISQMTGEIRYEQAAKKAVKSLALKVNEFPAAFVSLIGAWLYESRGGTNIKITRGWGFNQMESVKEVFNPFLTVMTGEGEEKESTAHICTGKSCLAPLTDHEEVMRIAKGQKS